MHDSDRRDMNLGYHVVDDKEAAGGGFANVIDRNGVLLGIILDQFRRANAPSGTGIDFRPCTQRQSRLHV